MPPERGLASHGMGVWERNLCWRQTLKTNRKIGEQLWILDDYVIPICAFLCLQIFQSKKKTRWADSHHFSAWTRGLGAISSSWLSRPPRGPWGVGSSPHPPYKIGVAWLWGIYSPERKIPDLERGPLLDSVFQTHFSRVKNKFCDQSCVYVCVHTHANTLLK